MTERPRRRRSCARGPTALGAALVVALLCVGAPSAHAQWLDLDAPGSPATGERGLLAATGRSLEEGIGSLRAREASNGGAAADAIGAMIAWRELALALLRAGTPRGDAGAVPIDGALRIHRELGVLDAFVQDALASAAEDEESRVRIVSALRASARAARRAEAPTIVDWDALDTLLRDVFLGLTELPGAWRDNPPADAWPDPRDTPPVEAPDLRARVRAFTDDEGAVAGAFHAIGLLAMADGSPAHRDAARAEAAVLRAALRAPEALAALPWREAQRAEAWRAALHEALAGLGDPGSSARARERLRGFERLAALADGVAGVAALGGDARSLRAILHSADAALPAGANDAADGMGASIDALGVSARGREALRADRIADQRVRAGFRADGARAEGTLFPLIAESIRDRGSLLSPAALSAFANHRTIYEGASRFVRAQAWPAELEGTPGAIRAEAARAVRAVLASHAQDDSRLWAVRRLERFERVYAIRADLRERDYEAWLSRWLRADNSDDEAAPGLERFAQAGAALRTLDDPGRVAALRAWSALGLDEADVAQERRRAGESLGDARLGVEAVVRDTATVRALAALAGVWGRGQLGRSGSERGAASDALRRLTHAPARGGAMEGSRDDLARFARWFTEMAHAERAGDVGLADDARRRLEEIGERLIESARRDRLDSPHW